MHLFHIAPTITPSSERSHPAIVPLSALAMEFVWSCDLSVSGRHKSGLCDMCWVQDSNGVVHTRDDLLSTRDDLPTNQGLQPSSAFQPSWAAFSDPPGRTLSDLFRPLGPHDTYAPVSCDIVRYPISCDAMADTDAIHRSDVPRPLKTRSGRGRTSRWPNHD